MSIIVSRSTRPSQLSIDWNNYVYHEQEVINRIFGTKDVWLSCSYLGQNSKCNWLDLNGDERLNTIEYISYADQVPDVYLNKAVQYANAMNECFNIKSATYQLHQTVFQEKDPYDPNLVVTELDVQAKEQELSETRRKLIALQEQLNKQNYNKGRIQQLEDNIRNIDDELTSIPTHDHEDISTLELEINKIQDHITLVNDILKQNKINEEGLRKYKQIDPNNMIAPLLDSLPSLSDVYKHDTEYNTYLKLSNECGNVPSNPEDLKTLYMTQIQKQEVYNTSVQLQTQEQSILMQLDKYKEITDRSNQRSQYLRNVLSGENGQHKSLNCPVCSTKLELSKTCLIVYNHPSVEELNAMKEELQALSSISSMEQQLHLIRQKIIPCEPTNHNISDLKGKIATLQKIIPIYMRLRTIPEQYKQPPIISPNILQAYIAYKSLPISRTVPTYHTTNTIDMLRQQINTIINDRNRIAALQQRKKQLSVEYDSISSAILPSIEETIHATNIHVKTLEQLIDKYKHAVKMQQLYSNLMNEYEELNQTATQQYIANQLVSIIEHTEYVLLEETIQLFNQCLSEIVASLFEEPITVKLELWKTSGKRTKPNVHLHISYKGMDITGCSGLSGGESSRLSIALMIAFYMTHPTPFIMIDESLSSINHQLRELALITFRRFVNAPVLIILHETSSEGLFDATMSI